MLEVPNSLLKSWIKAPSLSPPRFVPRNIDIECPNAACSRSLVNITLAWQAVSGFMLATCACANCKQHARFFLFGAPSDQASESTRAARAFLYPKPIIQGPFELGITEASPSFAEIHSQAQEAEAMGLVTLVGIGYRKALEFLIKDHLIASLPEKEASIKLATLSQCITNFVTEPRVKDCAQRAAWLGNDETHYERIWVEKDLQDLKVLIKLTQYWISSEVLTKQYSTDMVKK